LAIADFTSQDRFDARVQRPLAIELAPFLEREIITRRLEPGEKLVELDLCARFGVSRSPMRDAAAAGAVEDCFFANVALTDVLHEQCRNPVLLGLLAQVNKAALRYRHWAFCQAPSMIALSIGRNMDMVEAIRRGDAMRAEAVTKELVQDAWKLARQAFAERV